VKAGVASDAYIMTGYDEKSVEFTSSVDAKFTIEVDIDGTGVWGGVETVSVQAGEALTYTFPEGFSAYWVRVKSDTDTKATALFTYQ